MIVIPKIINKNRFYRVEHEVYSFEMHLYYTDRMAKKVMRKLCKHWKVEPITIKFNANRLPGSGQANHTLRLIKLPHNPDCHTLCHEIAHIISGEGHSKKCLKLVDDLITYTRKRNWFLERQFLVYQEDNVTLKSHYSC
jgi:hypothetical protein